MYLIFFPNALSGEKVENLGYLKLSGSQLL